VAPQRGEERGGAREHPGVAGERVLAWSGRPTAPPSGRQGPGSAEAPRAGEHGATPRAKRPSRRRGAESAPHRRASVWLHGRDAGGLPEPGRVETTPVEADPPDALEDGHTSAGGVPRPRSFGGTRQAGGGSVSAVVVPFDPRGSRRADEGVLRRAGCSPARPVTSTPRTAGCGPAGPVVWEGSKDTYPD